MYFHLHSTHSAPPPDSLGALRYRSGDHPQFTSLCHLPDILVSNPCLNSSDLGIFGPRSLGVSLALPDLHSRSSASVIQSHLIHSTFPSGTIVCTSFLSLSGIPSLDP